ncbi:hypothetical protein Ancab_038290 [Ancistrocladus abbreviatus]
MALQESELEQGSIVDFEKTGLLEWRELENGLMSLYRDKNGRFLQLLFVRFAEKETNGEEDDGGERGKKGISVKDESG